MNFVAATRDLPAVKKLFRFVWEMSARDQIFLSLLAASVFLVEPSAAGICSAASPMPRVDKQDFKIVIVLCLGYLVAAALMGLLKFWLNVYRSAVSERANRHLRLNENLMAMVNAKRPRHSGRGGRRDLDRRLRGGSGRRLRRHQASPSRS